MNHPPTGPEDDPSPRHSGQWSWSGTGSERPNLGPANARRSAFEPNVDAPDPHPLPLQPPPQQRGGGIRTIALVGATVVAALAGAVIGGLIVAMTIGDDADDEASPGGRDSNQISVEVTSAIADVAGSARPGVVRVESVNQPRAGGTDIGSGVVIDTQGYIVTNAHVVLETDSLQVVLADGTVRPAVLIGHDYPFTDVAVLQISPGGLTAIPIGDSSVLRLGETVVAIGNPLAEFDGTVTVGVVSGLNRVRTFDGVRQSDLIQTDAAVNSGNSGGALLNLDGQLVGMPTAVLRESRSGTSVEGLAFALPINRVMEIAQQIIDIGGPLDRATLDLEAVDITPATAAQFTRLQVNEGALVVAVRPGGVGAAAGIQPADVIIEVGSTAINSEMPLNNALAEFEPGQQVQVVFNRNGRIIEAEVRLAKRS